MEFLRERRCDADAVRTLVGVAFPTAAEARLVDALREAGDAVVSAVAIADGAVLGHAMLSRMSAPFQAVGLAPVAVSPRRQNEGIGTRLIAFALNIARREGWAAAFVLGAPRFYERFGYSADLAKGFQSPYAGPHFMVLPFGGSLPSSSGEVVYAPAFAALD